MLCLATTGKVLSIILRKTYTTTVRRGIIRTVSNIKDGAFCNTVIGRKQLTIFARHSIFDVWLDSEHASESLLLSPVSSPYRYLRKNCAYSNHFKLSLLEKFNLSHPDPWRKGKINFNFHFHNSLWPLKAFHEGFPKPSESPQWSVKIKI